MAEVPLLDGNLSVAEKVSLGNLTHHPGFQILDKLIRAAVDKANAKVMKVDPSDPNYNRILAATQQEARATNVFAQSVLKSIAYHAKVGIVEAETEEAKLLRRVTEARNSA